MPVILLITLICIANVVSAFEEDTSKSNLIPCKEGWYLFGEKCYKVFGQINGQIYHDASKSCRIRGGHLASIHGKELQNFLTSVVILNERKTVLIGLSKQDGELSYTWSDGSTVNYTNWGPNEPNRNHNCVEMVIRDNIEETGTWGDVRCTVKFPFLCQSNRSLHVESPDPRFCSLEKGGGWKYLNSCYHIVTKEKSWDDAETYCRHHFNGHLVKILDVRAEKFLNYVLSDMYMDFWMGVKIQDKEIQKWSSGWHVVFNRWDGEELVTGNCGLRTRSGLWIPDHCMEKHPFICETSSDTPPFYKQGAEGWSCPSKEWKDLEGDTCYIFQTTKSLSWYDANYACMTKGGALAKILSEDESIIIHPHVIDTRDRLFIGLHRSLDNKNEFQWLDGTAIDYQKWGSNEPNNINEECVEIWTNIMKWNDVSCNVPKGYICSTKKLPPVLYEEDKPPVQDNLSAEKSHCQDDRTGPTVMITIVCVLIISIMVCTVIYLLKTRCTKSIQDLNMKWRLI